MPARLTHLVRARIAVKHILNLVGFVAVTTLAAGLYLTRALDRFAVESLQADRVRRVKSSRDAESARSALRRLSDAAAGSGNVQPSIREAVAAYCTVGEIASVLKARFGEYQPPTKF